MRHIIIFIILSIIASSSCKCFGQSQNAAQLHASAIDLINDDNKSNDEEAIDMFKEALILNHTQSARYLGLMYWFGKGVEKDRREAQNNLLTPRPSIRLTQCWRTQKPILEVF